MNFYERLAQLFAEYGYTWTIGGEPRYPTDSDIQKVLDDAVKVLYSEPEGSLLEVGRLIVKRTNKTYDVYLHIGDIE